MIPSRIRSNLQKFKPYTSARSLYQTGTFFDANENAFGSPVQSVLDAELNRYPDPNSRVLRRALASFLAVSEENIFVGNGSDEAIDLLVRLFVEQDEEILFAEPTYGMYAVAGELSNVKVRRVPLRTDFTLDVELTLNATGPRTKLLFCCSPNNPTGMIVPLRDIERMCRAFKGIVVVDEAYIEFASTSSVVSAVQRFENLVVLRTFSKAWGLAGIRVGYAVAQKDITQYLNRIKPPYNLNRLSSAVAAQALLHYPKVEKWRTQIVEEREQLAQALRKLGFTVFPSEANFLLTRILNAPSIALRLATESGMITRDFGQKLLLKNCLRISVGTPAQNKALITSLRTLI
ncbi:MAG: histidinol-phosphate transaminase [Candidatus Taylorbacteria bacterium CG11_big_fil_rev_8_21_14_0_20_46_11]|uniref:Histidinol-phosphate aminotransferase n=1 Tax=Candidatus Taylorbacteria bacterium CG11_big_fil_rev_8_21_14_0_20_46_11 TaxID=1975025 RepID=A0A2H0KA50_9BACT|nr:MAG: histidinol-phosphate transaminase [Candidatus Taylorbacteria bacterium CG11_big_fil_rev_8_21_14_0_20_46_11]